MWGNLKVIEGEMDVQVLWGDRIGRIHLEEPNIHKMILLKLNFKNYD